MPEHPAVVCVDDEVYVLRALRRTLHDACCRVLTSACPVEALRLLDAEAAVAVFIADYNLPGMTGLDFLAQAHRKRPDATSILVSGHLSPRVLEKARAVAGHVLPKPWDFHLLGGLVQEALSRYAARSSRT